MTMKTTKAGARYSLILLFLITTYLPQTLAQADQLVGNWENELGSMLVVDSVQNYVMHGAYHSSSGVDGRIFPLQGWVNRSDSTSAWAVSFMVQWEDYGSITSWTGFLDEDKEGPYLKTLWHLVRPGEKEPWERIITNSSTFRRMER